MSVLAVLAPEVNAVDLTALVRLSDRDDLGVVGERGIEISEEGLVLVVRVVRVPPRDVREGRVVALWGWIVSIRLCSRSPASTY